MRTAILHTNTGNISELRGQHDKKEPTLEIQTICHGCSKIKQTSIKVKLSSNSSVSINWKARLQCLSQWTAELRIAPHIASRGDNSVNASGCVAFLLC